LARLGWSLDDKTENMSREFIVENFTLDRVVKGSAGLDPDKMLAYQEHWMGQLTLEQRVEQCLPYLLKAGLIPELTDDSRAFVTRLVVALGERLKLFSDIIGYDEYFVADDQLRYDEKAFDKRIRKAANAVELLKAYAAELGSVDLFDADALDKHMHGFVENRQIGMGDIIHAVRVAVTGKPAGPGMFECLELLGRDRCLSRIMRAIAMASRAA
jgi:glutamyl-tRNA synthetase